VPTSRFFCEEWISNGATTAGSKAKWGSSLSANGQQLTAQAGFA